MSLKAMYNEIESQYGMADKFGSVSESQRLALEEIKHKHLGMRDGYKVLDLGVGDAAFLLKLQHIMPNANFTGIDVSKETLSTAKAALPSLTTIEASASEASRFLPHHSQDLVLAHSLNAYVSIQTLFQEAALLTRSNGYFSLITTTYESFPVAQQNLAFFISKNSLMSRIIGHYYKTIVKNTTVASGLDELKDLCEKNQFKLVEHQRLRIPVTFRDIHDLALFSIEGTWFLNNLSLRMLPKNFLIQRLKHQLNKIFTFPYRDTHIIDVILAKK